VFLLVQTIRHRDFFVPQEEIDYGDGAHERPTTGAALLSLVLLLVALVAVVGLTKIGSSTIGDAVAAIGAPISAVGVVIALLVLLPETLAAVRNARRGRAQASLNLAFGSAIASIGLTIPVIAVMSLWLPGSLILGLGPVQIVLLALTVVIGALTVLPGRATVQEGALHLVICGTFIFLALVP
jgi:Ca2+:H+ antiporter